jgi:prephenate dehydrogenase
MKGPRFRRVVINGLGLLGGSLGLGLKKKKMAGTVVALGRDLGRLKPALKAGLVDEISVSPDCARGADLIVLCTPYHSFSAQLKALSETAPEGCLVTDVGSVKGAEVARWHRAAGSLRFVASHPMAGGEKSGWREANAGLFEGAACLITPLPVTDRRAVKDIGELWQSLGMQVELLSPEEHDRVIGRVSHLPHAVAFALAAAEARRGRVGDYALAGKGWFDTSRVGGSDKDLWADIFLHHPKRMERSLKSVEDEIARLRRLLKSGKRPALARYLGGASEFQRATRGVRA